MIVPNKNVRLDESALGKANLVLEQGPQSISVITLLETVSDEFESIDQFMLTLTLLFVLGRIEIDFNTGVLNYVA